LRRDRGGAGRQGRLCRPRLGNPAPAGGDGQADDFYFGSTCQIRLDRWSHGRVALLGDAGYRAAPTSGMGTSQALIAARALARHLIAANDHQAAFRAYEQELRPYVDENQEKGRQAAQTLTATPA
jgi:2-polyprenyl-6-methoxyphenol hydroxylase-like FAD-dependent oxidoreductase